MVLRPIVEAAPTWREKTVPKPIWGLIAARQKQRAKAYWLIAQPDHAALSGVLAANFASPHFPELEPEVVRAIGLHDSGWGIFAHENGAPEVPLTGEGKPRSFVEIAPADFTRAWTASIERAQPLGAVAGIMVSRHFCWLGEGRLLSRGDPPDDTALIQQFLEREAARQARLAAQHARSMELAEVALQVLQFCDVLSLYICCGAGEPAEFAQRFHSRRVRVRREQDAYFLDPSPFARALSLGVPARRYPASGDPLATTLAFVIT
jgi:hypothetical protein